MSAPSLTVGLLRLLQGADTIAPLRQSLWRAANDAIRFHSPRHIRVFESAGALDVSFTSSKFQPLRCHVEPSSYSTRLMTTASSKSFVVLVAKLPTLTTPVGAVRVNISRSL